MNNYDNHVVISDKRIVAYYLQHQVKPLDMFLHKRTDAIMFVYDRHKTAELYNNYLKGK